MRVHSEVAHESGRTELSRNEKGAERERIVKVHFSQKPLGTDKDNSSYQGGWLEETCGLTQTA